MRLNEGEGQAGGRADKIPRLYFMEVYCMDIIMVPVSNLKPYERNAKNHPDDQIEHIANSIREFGFRQPIVIDRDNVVVIGHGRLLAAKKLGYDEVPCTIADDLTDQQIKALRLADNKTNESGWDFTQLEAELSDLELDFDMGEFGFNGDELPPIPENLDVETDFAEEAELSIKFTFANYTAYKMYEDELKEAAERMGAKFAIVK